MKRSVLLINTTHEQGVYMPADATLGIATLQYWLAVDGIADTAIFPEDDSCTIINIEERFRAYLIENHAIVYGLSCWSNAFVTAETLAHIIRETDPEGFIVGGGAHFHSRDNITQALSSGLFDAVFRGGADPFFSFCTKLFKKHTLQILSKNGKLSLKGEIPQEGLHYINNGEPVYQKQAYLTRAVVPVMHITDSYAEITTVFNDKCPNNCDYCTVFKNSSTEAARLETEDFVRDAYKQFRGITDATVKISIMDSSPFLGENRALSLGVLRRLSQLDNTVFSMFADPDDLDDELLGEIKKHRIRTLFIGRDRISEDPFVGRRLRGKLRTGQELDIEQEKLFLFINKFSGEAREFYVGYIASPHDSAEDARRLLEEFRRYDKILLNKLIFQPNIFILNPYGGTTVGRKAKDEFWDVAEFSYPYPNVWKAPGTAMAWLELLRLVVSPVFSTGVGWKEGLVLLEYVAAVAFGKPYQACAGEGVFYDFFSTFRRELEESCFTEEESLEDWEKNIIMIYRWGLILVSSVKSPDECRKLGLAVLRSHIIRHDAMIKLLQDDIKLIRSKPHLGSWYEKYS